MADSLTKGVEYRVRQIKDVSEIAADLVFDPSWTPAQMTDRCKQFLWKK